MTSVYLVGLLSVLVSVCFVVCEPPSVCTQCLRGNSCVPPDCFCCREELQLPIPLENIPQIVFFTFDDAVTDQVAGFYKKLFDSTRKNPNGCPITMTLFISHENTKYRLVQEFYEKGMEIASHSVTHSTMNGTNFFEEAKAQKQNLAKLANIPINEITGWRSPFLKPTGDLQPDSLKKLGYSYDATLTYSKRSFRQKPPGPFTLDFGFPYECQVKPCPRNRHPGFWEVPVVSLMDYQHKYDCVYVDGCMNAPPDEDTAFQFLWDNFQSYYTLTRMPFGINMHPSWFYYPERLKAMDRFIQKLVSMNDVYIVSASRMLEWLKNPTPLQDLRSFTPWACDGSEKLFRSGVQTTERRQQQPRLISWGSRVAGVPRRYFTPRVMYPASLYTPSPTINRQELLRSGGREVIRPGIYTLTAQELDGRPPLYPGNVQLRDRLHRQRINDRTLRLKVDPSRAPRIATLSMNRMTHNDNIMKSIRRELPSPMPSVASEREIMGRRQQFERRQNMVEQQRQQIIENLRRRRIQRLQRQRHRELLSEQKRREEKRRNDKEKQKTEAKPTRAVIAKTIPIQKENKENLEKQLQQNIIWKPALLDGKATRIHSNTNDVGRKTTPSKVYQKTVKVWPLVTLAPPPMREQANAVHSNSVKQVVIKTPQPQQVVDELANYIQKVESQTNLKQVRPKFSPTQLPTKSPRALVLDKALVKQNTARPRLIPSSVSQRVHVLTFTPAPRNLESPLERQRRIQEQHLRRANETLLRQREREERLLRQQVVDLHDKQLAARRNRLQPEFSQFVPRIPVRPRFRPRPIMRPSLMDGQVFTGDVLHPTVAQRIAWNRFIRRMLGPP